MRVMIISLRNLILGGIVFVIVLITGIILLVSDPLNISSSYKPDAEKVLPLSTAVNGPFASRKPSLNMDVAVEETTAQVTLNTQNFQFVKEVSRLDDTNVHGQGHAHIYLDGKSQGMVYSPKFLLKNVPKGEHELRVELTYGNHLPYKVEAVRMIKVQ